MGDNAIKFAVDDVIGKITSGAVGAFDTATSGAVGAFDTVTSGGEGVFSTVTSGGDGAFKTVTSGAVGAFDTVTSGPGSSKSSSGAEAVSLSVTGWKKGAAIAAIVGFSFVFNLF